MTTRRFLYSGPLQTIALRVAVEAGEGGETAFVDTPFVPGETVDLDPEHRVTVVLADAGFLTPVEPPEAATAEPGTALAVLTPPLDLAQE